MAISILTSYYRIDSERRYSYCSLSYEQYTADFLRVYIRDNVYLPFLYKDYSEDYGLYRYLSPLNDRRTIATTASGAKRYSIQGYSIPLLY